MIYWAYSGRENRKERKMNNLNQIILEGTACQTSYVDADGYKVCRFNLEVHKTFPADETFTVRCICTDNTAAICDQFLKEKRDVRIVGSLDGVTDGLCVLVQHVEFLEGGKND